MAKLVSFIVCESLNNMPAGNAGVVTMLIAPQIALRPQFIPGNFSFGISIGISGIDLKKANKTKLVITSPNGEVLYDSGENELPIITKPDSLPEEYQGFMISIDIRNLTIPCEGAYTFSFYLNGEKFASQCVPIYKKVD